MKKIVLFLLMAVISLSVFSQKIVNTTSASAKFKKLCTGGDLIINTGTRAMYLVLAGKTVGTQDNITSALAGTPRIAQLAVATGTIYVDTLNDQNVRGVKTFFKPLEFSIGTQSIALGNLAGAVGNMFSSELMGNQAGRYASSLSNSVGIGQNSLISAISGTTELTAVGHQSAMEGGERSVSIGAGTGYGVRLYWSTLLGNNAGTQSAGLDVEGQIRIGNRSGQNDTTDNTLFIHSCDQTVVTSPDSTKATIYAKMDPAGNNNRIRLNADVIIGKALSGSSAMRGNAAFTTTETRVAIYIPGVASNNYFYIQPNAVDGATRPVAGDFCNAFAKTDSLVVMRQAGTTSGLAFDWFRVK